MKKLLPALFLTALLASDLSASPGDTTWVTIYNLRKITQYGNYDTSAVLPTGKTYRKIRLHYILGRYACPAGSQYCGSWDYTTHVFARPAGADSVEIARVITPYATDWLAQNRKHDYVVDVTDYSSILKGNLDFRYVYDGYSWGFTLTLKMEMIEGTPTMNALSAKNIYDGYYAYGKTADPIESHLTAKPFQYSSPVSKVFVKNLISGHGSDDTGCSEFCSKYYDLKINGTAISQKQLWRSDCGKNNVYPQTGTWVYERANWCPGNVVDPIIHDISSLTSAGSTFSVDVDMEPYTAPNQGNASAGFGVNSQLISCSAPSYNLDVSMEDIISPSNDPNYFRSNNICSNPKVKIKNTGTTAVTSVLFDYKLIGGQTYNYTWTGTLNFLEETIVDLGPSIAMFNGNSSNQFEVSINKVNGAADQDTYNNTYNSTFTDVRSFPMPMVVYFATNASSSTVNTGFNESSWQIVNDAGVVVKSRLNNLNSKVFRDTINLPAGCYTFIANDDGCDGISWWANTAGGTGTLRFSSTTSPAAYKTFNGDFGCQIMERFTVGYLLGVKEAPKAVNTFQSFPNPASSELNLLFDVSDYQDVSYSITDVSGKEVQAGKFAGVSSTIYPISTTGLGSGMYFVTCHFAKGDSMTKKIIINK
jgi:hypothetical protein